MSSVRDSRFNLRAPKEQLDRIKMAAEASNSTMTEFVLTSADAAAERVLADRRWFALDEEQWTEFNAVLDRPAVFKPRLKALLDSADPFVD